MSTSLREFSTAAAAAAAAAATAAAADAHVSCMLLTAAAIRLFEAFAASRKVSRLHLRRRREGLTP